MLISYQLANQLTQIRIGHIKKGYMRASFKMSIPVYTKEKQLVLFRG